jgi:orotate phosphoribosyltransferase
LESDDWKAAKEHFDKGAADRVIERLWSEKKTEMLRSNFKEPPKVVFITVPSSSGKNVVPLRLAENLAEDFNARYICGDEYFSAIHSRQSKHIPRLQRPFHRREYYPENIDALKKEAEGKQVVVVEDLLTTGGSVASFCRALNDEGIEVRSVTALMGDRRLNIDLKTQVHLDAALKQAGLSFKAEALVARLTRAEAGGLIMQINSARSENAKQKIARNLHGLLDQRPFRDVGRDPAAGRHPSAQRKDLGDAKISEGVSPWPVQPNRKRLTHYEILVKCCRAEYRKSVAVGPQVENRNDFLSSEAKGFAAKVAAKHQVKNSAELHVTVKAKAPEKGTPKVKDIGIGRSK